MRILLVEDEKPLAESIKRGLASHGIVVQIEHDGQSGLWAAREGGFDAIVLDIMLPRLNGYNVLRTLRQEENWTPVLMLTAKDGVYDQTDAFELGADDYLTKPFSLVLLAARLRALSRRGRTTAPTALECGTLSLDPQKRIVSRGGADIVLTAREFSLLEYLIRNQGQVRSKHEILQNVWDAAYEGPENVVEVYVGYLRKKIDVPFGLKTLQTVRGMGYRLLADRDAAVLR
ncbi:response regulator transcription factor [Cumulibacter manganitolerans]|uniref:response regulator transcription factor n=1 Tax=Cumulibacter manganitolerans TaxID=1884992 RepID=UPI001297B80A|nr:response regulator transcription factor [Cumulibacter manganitolerans]